MQFQRFSFAFFFFLVFNGSHQYEPRRWRSEWCSQTDRKRGRARQQKLAEYLIAPSGAHRVCTKPTKCFLASPSFTISHEMQENTSLGRAKSNTPLVALMTHVGCPLDTRCWALEWSMGRVWEHLEMRVCKPITCADDCRQGIYFDWTGPCFYFRCDSEHGGKSRFVQIVFT